MNAVQKIKERHDMDILLRAIQPRMKENAQARRAREKARETQRSLVVRVRVSVKEVP